MRIEPTGVQPALTQPPVAKPEARPADPAPAPVVTPNSPKDFALTGRLASLLASVSQDPPVRPDVVALAAARLAAGDFNTPEAAAAAAAAIIHTQPSITE